MKVFFYIFTVFSSCILAWGDELKFVIIAYRHGDRSPSLVYPTDPHPPTIWPNGLGQLTNSGKNQAYELGMYIRERYQDFLPSEYQEEDIQVMSSDTSRTLMTAYCVLAALYKPQGDDVWLESINWQPIPVHSLPQNLDNLMLNNVECPKFLQLLNDDVFSPNSQTVNKYKEIMAEVFAITGLPTPDNVGEVLYLGLLIHDCLLLEENRGLELPDWTERFYPEPLRNISKFVYTMSNYDLPLKRLHCGPILKDIIQHLEEVRHGTLNAKMWQYSGHDGTIIDLLQCMDIYDGELVPFAGAVFLELYEIENDFEVTIFYKKNDVVKKLEIPGCTSRCSLDLFKELVKGVIPDNWEEECKF